MKRNPIVFIVLSFFSALVGATAALSFFESSAEEPVAATEVHYVSHAAVRNETGPRPEVIPSPSSFTLPDFRTAAHRALDAVVHVKTAQQVSAPQGWYDWSGFFPSPRRGQTQVQTGSGSGVILDAEGYIVTNHHVIEGADAIEIGLNDNRTLSATLVGSDPTTDIAVLKVDSEGLKSLNWGDSDAVQVGDWVLAVGNPFDLTSTVTAGIVSAKARDIQLLRPDFDRSLFPIESFIQTDAAVNPGNSGGALVDVEGNLIGINTAIASRTGSYSGYAFAVPANLASKIASDLIEFGAVQRAYLGVGIRPVDEKAAQLLDLPTVSGVMISSITEGSGADLAGLVVGDVILSVGGTPTPSMPQLLERVNRYRPGQTTEVEVWRNGHSAFLEVALGAREGLIGVLPDSRNAPASSIHED